MTNKQQEKKMTNAEKLKHLEQLALEIPHGRECSEILSLGIEATSLLIKGQLNLDGLDMYRASGISFDFYIDLALKTRDYLETEGEQND